MSIPLSFNVTGGLSATNGWFFPVTGANSTYNGVQQFTNADYYAGWNGTEWGIYSTVSSGGSPTYSSTAGSSTVFPTTGWSTITVASNTTATVGIDTYTSGVGYTSTLPLSLTTNGSQRLAVLVISSYQEPITAINDSIYTWTLLSATSNGSADFQAIYTAPIAGSISSHSFTATINSANTWTYTLLSIYQLGASNVIPTVTNYSQIPYTGTSPSVSVGTVYNNDVIIGCCSYNGPYSFGLSSAYTSITMGGVSTISAGVVIANNTTSVPGSATFSATIGAATTAVIAALAVNIVLIPDTPVYPYERIINLQQYTLTSNDCTNPQLAIDDIETTEAVFPSGGSVATNTTRFLKVDWGYDAWITRIRINQSTTTSTSYAGINYESSYGLILNGTPAPQVPILAVTPIPEGNGVYSIYFTPPVLARGIEYYPDFNNPSLSSLPEVDLYQLQVYEDTVWQTGVSTNMPIQGPTPTIQFGTVGIELLTIYPWVAASSYPFPSASAVPLAGIQGLDFDAKSSLAIIRGGDSVHELASYETHRETTGKFMVEQSDLRTFSLFLGDQVIIDAASGSNGENQYATSLFGSQAPYFTIVGVSTHGDGTQYIVLPKVKITGFTRNISTDKPTDLEVSFKPFFDKTYKLQSGGTGGLFEFISNSGTSILPPS